jgi:hypothetical protein
MIKRGNFAETLTNKVVPLYYMINPVIIFFFGSNSRVGFCHKYFVFSNENHFFNKIHVNVKVDK